MLNEMPGTANGVLIDGVPGTAHCTAHFAVRPSWNGMLTGSQQLWDPAHG